MKVRKPPVPRRIGQWASLCLISGVLIAPSYAQGVPLAQETQKATANHQFVFKADTKLTGVSVVGSFNNWNKTANPMHVEGDGLTWHLTLPLNLGRYVYKFVLFAPDSEKWVVDPQVPLDETDRVNDNSVLVVVPPDYATPASPNDGQIAASALWHPHSPRELNYDEGKITLSLRARPYDLKQLWLRSGAQRHPLKLVRTADLYAYYHVTLPWNRKADLTYTFELIDGTRLSEFGSNGLAPKARPFTISAATFSPYLLTDAPSPLKMDGPLTTHDVAGPSWAANQTIYEVNLDVYNFPKGTALREYEKHLPVLKDMGVGILWFMPLFPRGQVKAFGSPYAVRDYSEINPAFGTKADFRHLVSRAHELGLHVIVDWVPNHTAWDNPFIQAHPDWYIKNDKGEIAQAFSWSDVAQLDYGNSKAWNQPLWNQMRDDMVLWVRDFDIDGFRADVAGRGGKVPVEFWNWLRPQLNAIKPVFMLAEADDAYLHPAFDMTYSWNLPPVLWDICANRKTATAIDDELRREARDYPPGAVRMRFLDNHDWHPHADWGWGDKPPIDTSAGLPQVAPLMVLCATLPGKPLLYNGQEMGFLKTDPSPVAEARRQSPLWSFYSQLLDLYKSQPAIEEGSFSRLPSNRDEKVYAFVRQRGQERVVVVVNLSEQSQNVILDAPSLAGHYRDWFGKGIIALSANPSWNLGPWDYRVYIYRPS
ncbi:alpha-amylase 2 [Abditibacteriota bacterium]|nr:alpha-amylase 2 [Abditibacteriota bacterium]